MVRRPMPGDTSRAGRWHRGEALAPRRCRALTVWGDLARRCRGGHRPRTEPLDGRLCRAPPFPFHRPAAERHLSTVGRETGCHVHESESGPALRPGHRPRGANERADGGGGRALHVRARSGSGACERRSRPSPYPGRQQDPVGPLRPASSMASARGGPWCDEPAQADGPREQCGGPAVPGAHSVSRTAGDGTGWPLPEALFRRPPSTQPDVTGPRW